MNTRRAPALVVVDVDPLVADVEDLVVEDRAVEVLRYPGVVRAGIGSTVWAHAGVVVDPTDGAVVHLAAGASLEQDRPGALERCEVTVTAWDLALDNPCGYWPTPKAQALLRPGRCCPRCGVHRHWREFRRDHHSPHGRAATCTACERAEASS